MTILTKENAKIGMKVRAMYTNPAYYTEGQIYTISDTSEYYIYINDDKVSSRNGMCYNKFEIVKEIPVSLSQEYQEVKISMTTGKISMSFEGGLTNEQLLEIMNIMKKGK